eukprot:TRINITY_DN5429_c0_g3_i2.p2 TRINITY_DN5429_c0_g3~~TRINITY_DN5429_c0_g3_i2.p2  ORF type:complete len:475 (-),score=157.49 TRINITY_DN5429_c0_g3_i2:3250-4674(-)
MKCQLQAIDKDEIKQSSHSIDLEKDVPCSLGRNQLVDGNKQLSRQQVELVFNGTRVTLKQIGINPCTIRSSKTNNLASLSQNKSIDLENGDIFCLLTKKYQFKVIITDPSPPTIAPTTPTVVPVTSTNPITYHSKSSSNLQDMMISNNSMKDKKRKSDDNKPLCKYGAGCYRVNPDHLEKFSHPHLDGMPPKKKQKLDTQSSFSMDSDNNTKPTTSTSTSSSSSSSLFNKQKNDVDTNPKGTQLNKPGNFTTSSKPEQKQNDNNLSSSISKNNNNINRDDDDDDGGGDQLNFSLNFNSTQDHSKVVSVPETKPKFSSIPKYDTPTMNNNNNNDNNNTAMNSKEKSNASTVMSVSKPTQTAPSTTSSTTSSTSTFVSSTLTPRDKSSSISSQRPNIPSGSSIKIPTTCTGRKNLAFPSLGTNSLRKISPELGARVLCEVLEEFFKRNRSSSTSSSDASKLILIENDTSVLEELKK